MLQMASPPLGMSVSLIGYLKRYRHNSVSILYRPIVLLFVYCIILLLSVSCPVAVIRLHCGASVTKTNSSYV